MHQPRSTLRLILYGFVFVALPLVIGLVVALVSIDRLAAQSQDALNRATQATRDSRILSNQITAMERHARQYLVLRDPALLDAYRDTRREFAATARKLLAFTNATPQAQVLKALLSREAELHARIDAQGAPRPSDAAVAEAFAELSTAADAILTGSSRLIDAEAQAVQHEAAGTQRLLLGLALGILPLTLVSVVVFTALIAQPIRQLGRAIRQLGSGDLSHPIRVGGPHDLRDLGGHLDWLRTRLAELEEQKTRFLQHMSHELKTPLTAIRESVDLIADRAVGTLNAQQAEIAQILRSNARELQSLIEDLLNFGTAQDQMLLLQREEVELSELIGAIIRNHKPTLLSKSIELELALQPLEIIADREKLATVIDNLFSNAIKFTPPGGRIVVNLSAEPSQVRLRVRDSGPGIPPEERDKVFDAFYQGKQQPSGYVKGSGLGLSIAREYVAAHDGSVAVLDQDGEGACVEVVLPRGALGSRQRSTA